ncbi:hypothetical protein QUF75_00540 [Desulfococcaceae bacterium HSG7]|nr:hypothetical protein [Desulfococcaceae bacterium HSG7]
MDAYINNKRLRIKPGQTIGKGGEADVFAIDGRRAVKIFKPPEHPDYAGNPTEQQGAVQRIAEHQKKLPAFPTTLPAEVIAPLEFVFEKSGKQIIGYTMPLRKNTQPLMRFADIRFRQTGVSAADVIAVFRDLHKTIAAIHRSNTVIGDFNDLNVLVNKTQAYIIDADSFQFKGFLCRMFTAKFIDPLLCDSQEKSLMPIHPYHYSSDWYAFTVMLMQCLLFVDPYGGIYRPARPSERMPHCQRPLKRITIFHQKVRYPKHALAYDVLPDDLLHYFKQVFIKDNRAVFPETLLADFHWTRCLKCGASHARAQCPHCFGYTPAAVKATVTVRGRVTAERLFHTKGVILEATFQAGRLQWLYHENGCFKRENSQTVIQGDLHPDIRFRLRGTSTYMGQNNVLAVIRPNRPIEQISVDRYKTQSVFDTNNNCHFWLHNGQLYRNDRWGPFYIGDVLAGQTLFWAGPQFGFGFYRAAQIQVAFVFDAIKSGINDSVTLPRFSGELVDCTCYFASQYGWFFSAFKENGKIVHQAMVIRRDGAVMATARGEKDDGSWLGTLYGKCAMGDCLFAVTADGVIRLALQNGSITALKEFPDTSPFIDDFCHLLPSPDGLCVVNKQEILILKIA